jgi:7tm Odorant receptor
VLIMSLCINRIEKWFKLLFGLYVASSCLFLINPIVSFVVYNETILIYPHEFPLVDVKSPLGYAFTVIIHLIVSCYISTGMSGSDGIYIFYGLHTIGSVGFLKIQLEDLAQKLTEENFVYEGQSIKATLRDIAIAYKTHLEFVSNLHNYFYYHLLFVVVTSVWTICMSLVAIVFGKWYAALGFSFAITYQLFITCAVGTIIESQVTLAKR